MPPKKPVLHVPAAHFLEQIKHECYFCNGTERMRFVQRLIHTGRSMRASIATWESSGRWWSWSGEESRNANSQKKLLGCLRGLLDTYCRHNYGVFESFSMQRRGRMVDFPGYNLSGAVASFLFILLTMKQSEDFRVIGPAHPILARVGEDALLTCQLLPKRTTMHMEVRWYRSEPSTPVFVHRYGVEVTEMQMEEYRGQVEWIENGIAKGNVALKIHNIQPSDNGQYWCHFQDGNYCGETSLLLKVAEKLQTELGKYEVVAHTCGGSLCPPQQREGSYHETM
ncbi:butyrophilin-like protein 2 [Pan paniscus]|uniref:butyrophilin-like protein 2 n=1 Tax=Pan paniscus TaxID=9597 RepID=UPI003007000F